VEGNGGPILLRPARAAATIEARALRSPIVADRFRGDGARSHPCHRSCLAPWSSVDQRHLRCGWRRWDRHAHRRSSGLSWGCRVRDWPTCLAPASTAPVGT